jgi:hypothetical protein
MKTLNTYHQFLLSVLSGALFVSLTSCAPPNPKLVAPPVRYDALEQNGPQTKNIDYNPKVDILFVVDNSDSMNIHQENLKKNIERFVEAFETNERLDFHIGVVSIFDSKRFGPVVKDFYPLGKLRPLKDPQFPNEPVAGPQYVTRAPRYAQVLGETLKIGVQARGSHKIDLGGPEFEESFTPVMAAVNGQNPGFLRTDAHLAVIMVTDANDDSTVSASAFQYFLWNLKGRDHDRFSAYAVLALEGCKQDPGGPPTKILEFLRMSQGRAYNLCDRQYGDKLAEAGRLIQSKASRIRIDLKAIPELDTLQVSFGGKLLPMDPTHGWTYDPEKIAVIVSGEAELKGAKDARLEIKFVPIGRFSTPIGHSPSEPTPAGKILQAGQTH